MYKNNFECLIILLNNFWNFYSVLTSIVFWITKFQTYLFERNVFPLVGIYKIICNFSTNIINKQYHMDQTHILVFEIWSVLEYAQNQTNYVYVQSELLLTILDYWLNNTLRNNISITLENANLWCFIVILYITASFESSSVNLREISGKNGEQLL